MIRKFIAGITRMAPFPGRYRLYTGLRKIFGDEPLPFVVPLRYGGKLQVRSDFWKHMYYLGDYEWDVLNFLESSCGPGDTVLDVGASIGICTVPLSIRVGKKGRVIAVEALQGNFSELMGNIARNGITNVTPFHCAASDEEGTLEVPQIDGGNYSLASESSLKTQVPTRTLDQIVADVGTIHAMKMDVEGSETRALRGARRLFAEKKIRVAVVEFNPYWLGKMGSSAAELYDLFDSYNLKVSLLGRNGKAKSTTRAMVFAHCERAKYCNLVLRPQ
jgi:FkbM family methyltransferase